MPKGEVNAQPDQDRVNHRRTRPRHNSDDGQHDRHQAGVGDRSSGACSERGNGSAYSGETQVVEWRGAEPRDLLACPSARPTYWRRDT